MRALGCVCTLLLVIVLLVSNMRAQLETALWWQSLTAPLETDVQQMLMHYSLLPRIGVALLAGAGLGVAGVLFQQILRNPLAEPGTLGIAAGAQLGITLATLLVAAASETLLQLAALLGGLLAGGVVLLVSWGRRLSPVTLILSGLVVGLYASSVKTLLALFNHERLQSLFLWSSGMLNQYDWSQVQFLWPRLLLVLLAVLLMLRPLGLLALEDSVVRQLGMRIVMVRIGGLFLAVALTAMVVSCVGVIGFIGLFAPLVARLLGARRLLPRILMAAGAGAVLLLLSDQTVLWLARVWVEVPTGVLVAVIGAPVLLLLLPRLRHQQVATDEGGVVRAERQLTPSRWALLLLALAGMVLLALWLGEPGHWLTEPQIVAQWRWPRVLSATAAGALLATAGVVIQRMTGNPMASPEVLGISAGAACGTVLLYVFLPGELGAWRFPAGVAGAALTLATMMLLARRGGYHASRLLLVGMTLSTLYGTVLTLFLVSGDPRISGVLSWLSGSTYQVTRAQTWWTVALALLAICVTPLFTRWLTLLPLGTVTAQSVGVPLSKARILMLLWSAMLIAAATLCVGPLSFVGLIAPHLARLAGFRRALPQWIVATVAGAAIMLLADAVGRIILFPYQIPAGLLATLLGAPWFIWLVRQAR